jgi:hypothetical protein
MMKLLQVVLSVLCIRRRLQPLAQNFVKSRHNSAGKVLNTENNNPNLSLWTTRDPPLETVFEKGCWEKNRAQH